MGVSACHKSFVVYREIFESKMLPACIFEYTALQVLVLSLVLVAFTFLICHLVVGRRNCTVFRPIQGRERQKDWVHARRLDETSDSASYSKAIQGR